MSSEHPCWPHCLTPAKMGGYTMPSNTVALADESDVDDANDSNDEDDGDASSPSDDEMST